MFELRAFRIKAAGNYRIHLPLLLTVSEAYACNYLNTIRMKKRGLFFAATAMFAVCTCQAQTNFPETTYWVGSGTDSAIVVIDFADGTWDTSYVWGYAFNGTATGEDALNAIAAADVNLIVNIAGGFLNDIIYNNHSGIGGSPDYWSTWSGTDYSSMAMNMGITTSLSHGDWFGCSYTDFSPAIEPGYPIPAYDPAAFTFSSVVIWVGTGSDSAVLVIDFLDGTGSSSYAWGYKFSGTKTGEDMLNDIAAHDPNLTVNISGGFLMDIQYNGNNGTGGAPNYWATWSATNLGNWDMNMGIGTILSNGDYFGASYTDFMPALRPEIPMPVATTNDVQQIQANNINIYPNPASGFLHVSNLKPGESYIITNAAGLELMHGIAAGGVAQANVENLPAGIYFVKSANGFQKFIKI
jgi:hypothetical protein